MIWCADANSRCCRILFHKHSSGWWLFSTGRHLPHVLILFLEHVARLLNRLNRLLAQLNDGPGLKMLLLVLVNLKFEWVNKHKVDQMREAPLLQSLLVCWCWFKDQFWSSWIKGGHQHTFMGALGLDQHARHCHTLLCIKFVFQKQFPHKFWHDFHSPQFVQQISAWKWFHFCFCALADTIGNPEVFPHGSALTHLAWKLMTCPPGRMRTNWTSHPRHLKQTWSVGPLTNSNCPMTEQNCAMQSQIWKILLKTKKGWAVSNTKQMISGHLHSIWQHLKTISWQSHSWFHADVVEPAESCPNMESFSRNGAVSK